jgi:hypothetical protein
MALSFLFLLLCVEDVQLSGKLDAVEGFLEKIGLNECGQNLLVCLPDGGLELLELLLVFQAKRRVFLHLLKLLINLLGFLFLLNNLENLLLSSTLKRLCVWEF